MRLVKAKFFCFKKFSLEILLKIKLGLTHYTIRHPHSLYGMADHVCQAISNIWSVSKLWESLLSLLLDDDNQVNLLKPLVIAMLGIVVSVLCSTSWHIKKRKRRICNGFAPESELVHWLLFGLAGT